MRARRVGGRTETAGFALLIASAFVGALGCASGGGPDGGLATAAVDPPPAFLVVDGEQTRPARAGEGCRNPMVDPRDGTRLVLMRSAEGRGDYAVPAGRYGVRAGYLLRLDCATGAVVSIVRDRS